MYTAPPPGPPGAYHTAGHDAPPDRSCPCRTTHRDRARILLHRQWRTFASLLLLSFFLARGELLLRFLQPRLECLFTAV